jgi:hypothetical protein
MQIYGMIIGDELKYVGLKKSSVQKMVDHQKEVYKFCHDAPKVWLAVMEPVPSRSLH